MQLVNTVKLVRSSLNPRLEMGEGILLTMFDKRANSVCYVAFGDSKALMKRCFNDSSMNVKLSECPVSGKPTVLYDIDSKGSEACPQLAKSF